MAKALCGLIAIFVLFVVLKQCVSSLVGAGIDQVVDLADDHVGINRKPNPTITHNIDGSMVFEYVRVRCSLPFSLENILETDSFV